MKSSSQLLAASLSAVLFALISANVCAQEKSAPPPPKLEKIEELGESDIKLPPKPSNKVKTVERRQDGVVTEVQVRSGGSTYTVKGNQAPRGTPEGDANRAATWKVFEFGGAKKQAKEADTTPAMPQGSSNERDATKKVAPKVDAKDAATSAPATVATPVASSAAASAASATASAPVKK